ncbi:MAG: hypothetical protein ACI4TM_03400 [Candidatus Cryptobacteroides sp.]
MKQNTPPLAGPYTAPTCKVINIELDGAILSGSGNNGTTENIGDDINYGW